MGYVLVSSLVFFLFSESTSYEMTGDNSSSSMESTSGSLTTIWVTFAAAVVMILVIVACGILARKLFRGLRESESEEDEEAETSVMLTSFREVADISASHADIKNQFRKELQKTYKHQFNTTQRTTFLKDSDNFPERVFVESGLKFIGARQDSRDLDDTSNLNSYKDIFYIAPEKSSMIILEGEPGYGKSQLALQLAYDWCSSIEGSFLSDVEILILLRLRQCRGVNSVYRAIKELVLPKNTGLTESDIKSVLQHSESVMVILDSLDEYSDDASANSDIFKIIARKMFQEFRVVVMTTSSCLPPKYPPSTKRVKLTGFDEKARRNYMSKALIGDDDESAGKILGYLKRNPTLNDVCEVPFLFVQFAHMAQSSECIRQKLSVTAFFHQIIPIRESERNENDKNNLINGSLSIEHGYLNLAKIAFEALNSKAHTLIWTRKEMLQQLEQKAYENYIDCGILVEEEGICTTDEGTSGKSGEIEVAFYHKILQEWYAAHFLAQHLRQNTFVDLREFLKHLDPLKHQYVYRFACGLSDKLAGKITEYLKEIENDEDFVILCMFEQSKEVENLMKTVRKLCSEGINISGHDNLLQQKMSVNILEIAKQNNIPVRGVHLQNCIRSVDLSIPAIITLSGLKITSDIPLKNLSITLTERNLEDLEAENIMEFAAQCKSLRLLVFGSCVPPFSFKIWKFYSNMKSRNVKVGWRLFDSSPFYILNFDTGTWQSKIDRQELGTDDYENMKLERKDASKMWTEEYSMAMAKADRRYLRNVPTK